MHFKFLIAFWSIILISSKLFAQEQKLNNEDAYLESLKIHINSIKEYEKDLDTIFVMKGYYLNDYSGSIEDVIIVMVNDERLYEKTKKKKSISLKVIHPMEFREGVISIFVTTFVVSRRRQRYTRENSGFTKVQMKYDCDKPGFVYSIATEH